MGQERAEYVMDRKAKRSRARRHLLVFFRETSANHGSINQFCNNRTRSPVALGGSQESIQKAFNPCDFLKDMVVPPQTTVQGKSQVMCLETIRNGASVYRDGAWWDDTGLNVLCYTNSFSCNS